jgi:hypothetical protein
MLGVREGAKERRTIMQVRGRTITLGSAQKRENHLKTYLRIIYDE